MALLLPEIHWSILQFLDFQESAQWLSCLRGAERLMPVNLLGYSIWRHSRDAIDVEMGFNSKTSEAADWWQPKGVKRLLLNADMAEDKSEFFPMFGTVEWIEDGLGFADVRFTARPGDTFAVLCRFSSMMCYYCTHKGQRYLFRTFYPQEESDDFGSFVAHKGHREGANGTQRSTLEAEQVVSSRFLRAKELRKLPPSFMQYCEFYDLVAGIVEVPPSTVTKRESLEADKLLTDEESTCSTEEDSLERLKRYNVRVAYEHCHYRKPSYARHNLIVDSVSVVYLWPLRLDDRAAVEVLESEIRLETDMLVTPLLPLGYSGSSVPDERRAWPVDTLY